MKLDVGELIRWIVLGVIIVIFAYAIVRGMSFAYFRSKLEHRRAEKKLEEE